MKLLQQLCKIQAPSGNEIRMKEFLLSYIKKEMKKWKVKPEVFHEDEFQDSIILKFGKPRTAIFAHMDSIGFTVRYFNQLLPIGSPDAEMGTKLVGEDSLGAIECELEYDKDNHAFYKFGRVIDRGTSLTYKINFRDTKTSIQSAYLDNRLGVYAALKVAENLKDGVIAFSCWEEHGGGSVPYLIKFISEKWNVKQALVSDITWVSDGVEPGKGVAISMRDKNLPRRSYVDRIIAIARKRKVDFQLEVEGMGSSDGRELQTSPYPIDWCFVGAPEHNPHTPDEKVHKHDIDTMIELYGWLMKDL
ncbi:MAG: M20/M25/M40 family metallo-hydrolase [Chryseolinea sp.]